MAEVVAAGPVCHESVGVTTAGTSLELEEKPPAENTSRVSSCNEPAQSKG